MYVLCMYMYACQLYSRVYSISSCTYVFFAVWLVCIHIVFIWSLPSTCMSVFTVSIPKFLSFYLTYIIITHIVLLCTYLVYDKNEKLNKNMNISKILRRLKNVSIGRF